MTLVQNRKATWWGLLLTVSALLLALPTNASAGVRLNGVWPDEDHAVSLQAAQVTRQKALQLLAEATGWSIVGHDLDDGTLDLAVHDQPAVKVLNMILSDRDYLAQREGGRVTIGLDTNPTTPTPAVPLAAMAKDTAGTTAPVAVPSPPAVAPAVGDDRDRVIMGGDLRIEKGEHVNDVEVFGGRVDVWGVVEGDLDVKGGDVRLHEGAHVVGDVSAFGGDIEMAKNSRIDGDLELFGGSLKRDPSAHVGGSISDNGGADEVVAAAMTSEEATGWTLAGMVDDVTSATSRTALLFILGAIFWALAMPRMEILEVELAKQPMKSLAMGVVSILTAFLAAALLTVTVLGIPFAVAGLMVTIVAAYVGACVVLSTLGQALLRHRTKNRYIHLALGCFLFLLLTAIPYAGTLVWSCVLLTGLGTVVLTRGAGMIPIRPVRVERGPYRTAAT